MAIAVKMGFCLPLLAATRDVSVSSFVFTPASTNIPVGDTVRWTWINSGHTSTSDTNGLWDSTLLSGGQTFSRVFSTAGVFPYHCIPHVSVNMRGTITVQATGNSAPTVTVTNPANGVILVAPASFVLGATASDSDGSVTNVQFLQGAVSLGNDTTAPYGVSVSSLAAGSYSFSAVASDNLGAKSTNSISLTVNALPTVAITNPASGTVFTAPASFVLGATASDNGSITNVQFLQGTTSLGNDTSVPYGVSVSGLAAGSYSFSAVASDNLGAKSTNTISLTVNGLPLVTITNPANGVVLTAPASFVLGVTASDDGSITNVQFLQGTTSLGNDTSVPYGVSVSSLAAGSYSFSAVASDNLGARSTNTISLTVNGLPSVTITNPANGVVLAAPASFVLGATASDDGSITNVQFLRGTTSLGNDTSAPYGVSVTGLGAGDYSLSAIAFDNLGAKATNSISVHIVTPVAVVISAPAMAGPSSFEFRYSANAGLRYVIQRSLDLKTWNALDTNIATGAVMPFVDSAASASNAYYRVGLLPNP